MTDLYKTKYKATLNHRLECIQEDVAVLVDFIEKQSRGNQNFMLYVAYNAPHTPLQATEKYLSRFPHIKDTKRKTYAAMVSAVDDGDNVLVTSDPHQVNSSFVFNILNARIEYINGGTVTAGSLDTFTDFHSAHPRPHSHSSPSESTNAE